MKNKTSDLCEKVKAEYSLQFELSSPDELQERFNRLFSSESEQTEFVQNLMAVAYAAELGDDLSNRNVFIKAAKLFVTARMVNKLLEAKS